MTWQLGACKRARAPVSSSKFPRELSAFHPTPASRSNFSPRKRYCDPGGTSSPARKFPRADSPFRDIPRFRLVPFLSLSSIERGIGVRRESNQRGKPISFLEFDNDFVSILGHVRSILLMGDELGSGLRELLPVNLARESLHPLVFQTPRVTIRSICLSRANRSTSRHPSRSPQDCSIHLAIRLSALHRTGIKTPFPNCLDINLS